MIVWPSVQSFNNHDKQKHSKKKNCMEEKVIIWLTFNLGLALQSCPVFNKLT